MIGRALTPSCFLLRPSFMQVDGARKMLPEASRAPSNIRKISKVYDNLGTLGTQLHTLTLSPYGYVTAASLIDPAVLGPFRSKAESVSQP